MKLFRKILSWFFIFCAFISLFVGFTRKDILIPVLITCAIYSFIAFLIWPKKKNGEVNSNKEDTSSREVEKIYKNERPLPNINNVLGNSIFLPDTDNWETDFLSDGDGAIPLNILCFIFYKDAKGQESKRRITVKKLVPWDNSYALLAFCHERQSHRTFILNRITELYDLETGELIENPMQFFIDRYNNSPIGLYTKLLSEIEDQVLVLTFIARADGKMTKKEREIICKFISQKSKIFIDQNIIDNEIKRTYCQLSEFNKSIKKLKELNKEEAIPFLKSIDELIEVDNKKDPFELAALEKVKKYIQK